MSGRGILVGSAGAVIGTALGGALAWLGVRLLDPGIEPVGSWLLELRGPLASIVLVGAGAGLLAGCTLALAARGHRFPLLTAVLVLAALPFATPLVTSVGRLGWWAAGVSGTAVVTGAVLAARWLVTGVSERRERLRAPDGVSGAAPSGRL